MLVDAAAVAAAVRADVAALVEGEVVADHETSVAVAQSKDHPHPTTRWTGAAEPEVSTVAEVVAVGFAEVVAGFEAAAGLLLELEARGPEVQQQGVRCTGTDHNHRHRHPFEHRGLVGAPVVAEARREGHPLMTDSALGKEVEEEPHVEQMEEAVGHDETR